MDEAIKIADQIILMKDGQVVQKGTPQEILSNPAMTLLDIFWGRKIGELFTVLSAIL